MLPPAGVNFIQQVDDDLLQTQRVGIEHIWLFGHLQPDVCIRCFVPFGQGNHILAMSHQFAPFIVELQLSRFETRYIQYVADNL